MSASNNTIGCSQEEQLFSTEESLADILASFNPDTPEYYYGGQGDFRPCGVTRSIKHANKPQQVYGSNMAFCWNRDIDKISLLTGPDNMSYLNFKSVVNLEVTGTIPMNKLEPNKSYKGVFEVKLANDAFGWDVNLVTIEVSGPGGLSLSSMHNVLDEKSLTTAPFTTANELTGDLTFRLYQKSGDVKKGLIIKRFVVKKENLRLRERCWPFST